MAKYTSIAERQKAEKAFRHEVKNMDDVRMPFSSVHDAQVKLYNVVYSYNGIKRNFKQVENEGFLISFRLYIADMIEFYM